MSLFTTQIQHESKRPIRVTSPRLYPDGKTWSRIGVKGSGWSLALSPDEAQRLVSDLVIALEDARRTETEDQPHG